MAPSIAAPIGAWAKLQNYSVFHCDVVSVVSVVSVVWWVYESMVVISLDVSQYVTMVQYSGAAWLEQNGRGHVNGEQREVLAKALCLVREG